MEVVREIRVEYLLCVSPDCFVLWPEWLVSDLVRFESCGVTRFWFVGAGSSLWISIATLRRLFVEIFGRAFQAGRVVMLWLPDCGIIVCAGIVTISFNSNRQSGCSTSALRFLLNLCFDVSLS